ncbi:MULTISPECIES: hypothetical protein [unclassified Nocardia]|uniref:hypothetical protein n=1 Tax=unclassified Nocardia TaxID=2637762 RepID=UPI001CE41961|nr:MULTISPECIES: hypothetical protein [unclassified Nocardia]
MGSYQGNACSFSDTAISDELAAKWKEDFARAAENVEQIERLNADQRGGSWSIPVPEGVSGRIPVWTSPESWRIQIQVLLRTERGDRLRAAQDVAREKVLDVAEAMSTFANRVDGRGMTASNFAIARRAKVSERVVSRVKRLLLDLGMAVEVRRGRRLSPIERMAATAHHHGKQIYAASVWYLTSPRHAVLAVVPHRRSASIGPRSRVVTAICRNPQVSVGGELPPSRGVSSSSCVRKFSPTRAKNRAGRAIDHKTAGEGPRALHLQKAAAVLESRLRWRYGQLKQHIGVVADAIVGVGIDTARYSGEDIDKLLNRYARESGWSWPSQLTNPKRFLTTRLARIDWSGPSPSEQAAAAAAAAARRAQEQAAEFARRRADASSPEFIAQIRAQITQDLNRKKGIHR